MENLTLKQAMEQFATDWKGTYTVVFKADGTIFINRGGKFATIKDGVYTQKQGCSWRSNVQEYASKAGIDLK